MMIAIIDDSYCYNMTIAIVNDSYCYNDSYC